MNDSQNVHTYYAGATPVLEVIDGESFSTLRAPDNPSKEVCIMKSMLSMFAEDLTKRAETFAIEVAERKLKMEQALRGKKEV